jgi:hypothetical protein
MKKICPSVKRGLGLLSPVYLHDRVVERVPRAGEEVEVAGDKDDGVEQLRFERDAAT